MKTTVTLFIAVMAFCYSSAQTPMEVRLDSARVSDSTLRALTGVRPLPVVIDAVLRDFPNNLRNLTGELMIAQGEIENYTSIMQLPGSEKCVITRYHSRRDTTVSWQAEMTRYDEYGKAASQYRELFNQLQHCTVQMWDGTIINLQGKWEPSKEDASFTSSTFKLRTGDPRYTDVKVEIELVYLLADWGVNINVVAKRPDDEVGGTAFN